jgi:hypothetical protein
MTRTRRDLLIPERTAVDKKQVRQTIVVVIEDDHAARHGLRQKLVGAGAVLVLKNDANLFRHVTELDHSSREILLREERRRQQHRDEHENRVLHQLGLVCSAASYR